MSKQAIDVTDSIMSLIKTGTVQMKPRWYFVVGSLAMMLGLVGVVVVSAFFVSLISFSLRTHGPMGAVRYQQLIDSFPWWSIAVIVLGMGVGIFLLKQYDFSYKRNFGIILIGFVTAIMLGGWLLDYTGLNNIWMRRGPMRRLYEQNENYYNNRPQMRSPGWRWQR